ncbi:MAG: hypothetical protein AB7S38_41845 [Vulcanimicrobiota bacterium]
MKSKLVLGLLAAVVFFSTAASAKELYVRNQPFRDAYFAGSETYVPLSSFLKATGTAWEVDGSTVTILKHGSSPAIAEAQVTLKQGSDSLSVDGIQRGQRVYVPLKPVAKFLGLGVIDNSTTGIVDVVSGRLISKSDEQAAQELKDAKQAKHDAQQEAWAKRVEKHRAAMEEKKAKEEAASADEDEEEAASADSEDEEAASVDDEDEAEDKSVAAADDDKEKKTVKSKKTKKEEADEEEEVEETPAPAPEADKKDETPPPPPKAELLVENKDANPNYYTGDVVFTVTVVNRGNAPAENVRGVLKVVGPDKRVWVTKNVYGPKVPANGTWTITEPYKHRAGPAMPRGAFDIDLKVNFTTAQK